LLIGDGKEKANLQAEAARMKLVNVCFLPPVPKEQMRHVLAAADACLAILKPLELYKTTYPNKVFDYMAAGRPVILAIDGVIRQVVEASGCGIFVPPGSPSALAQAVREMAADPARARSIGLAGRRYVETRFNRRILAGKLALMLEEMRGSYG
jgi:glycosyltransferase involved in cell wall biosynthesis